MAKPKITTSKIELANTTPVIIQIVKAVELRESSEKADKLARTALYKTLASVMDVMTKARTDVKAFNQFCASERIEVRDPKKPSYTSILRAVWGNEHPQIKSVLRYATVLENAEKEKKTSGTLLNWIEENNGIEAALRNARGKPGKAPSDVEKILARSEPYIEKIEPITALPNMAAKLPEGYSILLAKNDGKKAQIVRIMDDAVGYDAEKIALTIGDIAAHEKRENSLFALFANLRKLMAGNPDFYVLENDAKSSKINQFV